MGLVGELNSYLDPLTEESEMTTVNVVEVLKQE